MQSQALWTICAADQPALSGVGGEAGGASPHPYRLELTESATPTITVVSYIDNTDWDR